MSNLEIGLWSLPAMLALIFLRMPIGLAMFLTGGVGLVLVGGPNLPLAKLKSETFTTFSSYSLSIVPMFLLMGHFSTLGGLSTRLFRAAEGFLGHRRGGVAMAAIGACAGFGAICGSSLATAATMSRVALPELRRYGYDGGFATATLAAGGTLGILIPPSIVLVIYAILAEQNIAKLFLVAFVPGVMAAIGYMIVISIYVRLYPKSAGIRPPIPWPDRLRALFNVWPVLLVFGLVVGGIYRGWFTPTEGASVGAFGTGLVAWLNGGLNRRTLVESFYVTARATAMIFFIVLGAAFYNGFLALTQVPQEISKYVIGQGLNPWMVMTLILIFYLILGCLMDSLSMILLTIPIFFPVVVGLDYGFVTFEAMQADAIRAALAAPPETLAAPVLDTIRAAVAQGVPLTPEQLAALDVRVTPTIAEATNREHTAIWFGILALIAVEVGLITPPVGMNLFVLAAMDRATPILHTYKAVVFFVASDIVRVAILMLFPAITLFLL